MFYSDFTQRPNFCGTEVGSRSISFVSVSHPALQRLGSEGGGAVDNSELHSDQIISVRSESRAEIKDSGAHASHTFLSDSKLKDKSDFVTLLFLCKQKLIKSSFMWRMKTFLLCFVKLFYYETTL